MSRNELPSRVTVDARSKAPLYQGEHRVDSQPSVSVCGDEVSRLRTFTAVRVERDRQRVTTRRPNFDAIILRPRFRSAHKERPANRALGM